MKWAFVAIAVFVCVLARGAVASAHTLKVDGSIGVTLHSDPNDDLSAGRLTTFSVDIKDKAGRFDPARPGNCECIFTISRDGKQVAELPITAGDVYVPLTYTFKEGGVYVMTVKGTPTDIRAFSSFSVDFKSYVRSGTEANTDAPQANALRPALPFVMLVAGLLLLLIVIDPFKIRRT